MKLRKVEKGPEKKPEKGPEKKKPEGGSDASKRGRASKRKGAGYERKVAKALGEAYHVELRRTPQSGGFAKGGGEAFRGDVVAAGGDSIRLHIECKDQKAWQLRQWLAQAEGDCPEGKVPVVVFHEHGTSKDYACLPLEGFLSLVPESSVVERGGSE